MVLLDQEFTFLDENQRERLSRLMAFHLRHDAAIERTPEGFVDIQKLTEVIRRKIKWVKPQHIREVAIFDTKGRYELDRQLIRARYGHSVEVKLDYPEANVDVLYYAVAPEAVPRATAEGLKPLARKMVHLSPTVERALEAGRVRTENPVVLEVDVKKAKELGIKILRASDRVYLAPEVPPPCLKPLESAG